jgi:hypothetical protein
MAAQDQLNTKAARLFVAMDACGRNAHRPRSGACTRPLDARHGRAWTSTGRRCEIASQTKDAGDGRPWTVGMDAPHLLRGVHPSQGGQTLLTMACSRIHHGACERANRP